MTPNEFRQAGHALVEWIAAYRERVEQLPVQSVVEPGALIAALPDAAPESGEPFSAVLGDLDTLILPGITHWQHPSFFGYFPSGGALASALADLAGTGLAVVGLNWQASPALTELEQVTTNWMRDLLGLPPTFSGVIHDTASIATFVALVCARERDFGGTLSGMQGGGRPKVVYVSTQAHSSVAKASMLAGFGASHTRSIGVDRHQRMRADLLEAAIIEDERAGRQPCAIVATSGTTATTAFDPLTEIGTIARRHQIWLHVDAAMGGGAMILPECRPLWAGIERADSVVVNAHKWLGIAFDCSIYFVADSQHLVRVMSTNPSYLQTTLDTRVRNYRDWGVPLGRRFRALKLWFVLRDQGAAALRDRLRRDLEHARWLADQIDTTPAWVRVAESPLQTVCVRHEPSGLSGDALNRHTLAWVGAINNSGVALLTPAQLDGRWMVRVSIGTEATQRRHVVALWERMREAAEGATPPTPRS